MNPTMMAPKRHSGHMTDDETAGTKSSWKVDPRHQSLINQDRNALGKFVLPLASPLLRTLALLEVSPCYVILHSK